jgi:hypothetical protein
MQKTDIKTLGLMALVLFWVFDQLFWGKAPGISVPLFTALCLMGGGYLAWRERSGPALTSLMLILPVLIFSLATFIREEPFTRFTAALLGIWGLGVLSLTLLGGKWWRYSLIDYFHNVFTWIGYAIIEPPQLLLAAIRKRPDENPSSEKGNTGGSGNAYARRPALSLVFGLILALPMVVLLAGLLASADPIFSHQLGEVLKLLSIELWPEYFFRLIYISIGAYVLVAAYLHALLSSPAEKVSESGKVGLARFVGSLEAMTVLVCVNLLFAFFVTVQFRYFFGGHENIALDGFTYAEYARRGFGEMLAVAIISLLLLLGLSAIARRDTPTTRILFSGMGVLLVLLVSVILVSAFQRLLLYEQAYGFTRIRTYTHVFMVWLGILLLATAVLESLGRLRYFALAVVLTAIGYSLTLSLINVDGLIVRQNVARTIEGNSDYTGMSPDSTAPLDTAYLVRLSNDATPVLFELYSKGGLPLSIREEVGAILACRFAILRDEFIASPWPSFHLSQELAIRQYNANVDVLLAYPIYQGDRGLWYVRVNEQEKMCTGTLQRED